REISLDYNNSFLSEYECSSLALDREGRRDEKEEIKSLEIRSQVVPKVDDISLVDGVFDGAFGGDREKDFVMGEVVVVESSSLEMLTKSCLGGMMDSLILLEGLEEEA
nr:hypothetical protein [Tanacetum cinerariifolium]